MKKRGSNPLIWTVLALSFFLSLPSRAFDVSAYKDAVSTVRGSNDGAYGCWDKDQAIANLPNKYEVLQWWEEMGITNLCVVYNPDDFANHLSGRTLQVMNWRYTEQGFKYVDGQRRTLDFNTNYFHNSSQYGEGATLVPATVIQDQSQKDVLAIGDPTQTTAARFIDDVPCRLIGDKAYDSDPLDQRLLD
ncbi:hypothetical protein KKH18_14160, partial [bacterium]|nr:hypothetical protein [bacterium]